MSSCRSASPGGSAPAERDRVAAAIARGRARRVRAMPIRASCRAACGCACRSPARWSPAPTCCCSTSPSPRSTRSPGMALNDDLLRLWETHRPTILFVTHSVFESVYLSTRIAVMTRAPRADRRRPAGRPAAAARARRCAPTPGIRRDVRAPSRRALAAAMAASAARLMIAHSTAALAAHRCAPLAVGRRSFLARRGKRSCGSRASRPTSCRRRARSRQSLWTDGPSLLGSLLVTLRITLAALAAAALFGGAHRAVVLAARASSSSAFSRTR